VRKSYEVTPPDFHLTHWFLHSVCWQDNCTTNVESVPPPPCLPPPTNFSREEWLVSQTNDERSVLRRLVWIDKTRFRGFGCSECAWVFNSSGSPSGNSFDEMMRNFELQRDNAFASHVCADHPRNRR